MVTMPRSSFLHWALLDAIALTIVGRLTTSCHTKVLGTKGLGSTRGYAMSIGGSPVSEGEHYSLELGFSLLGGAVIAALTQVAGEGEGVAKDHAKGPILAGMLRSSLSWPT
jgi:hypothetical protein